MLNFIKNIIGSNSDIQQIDGTDFLEKTKSNAYQVVDVRTKKEHALNSIKNSILIPYPHPEFNKNISKLDKSKPVIVFCRSGARSNIAAKEIKKNGFEEVLNLKGGMISLNN